MRIFMIVFFGMGLLSSFFKSMQLMFKDYPRRETFTLGEDCARLIEGVALTGWAAYLLWG